MVLEFFRRIWNYITFSRYRYQRLYELAVADEVLTDDFSKAKYIVFQADGKIRLVVEKLFARDGDTAYAIDNMTVEQRVRWAEIFMGKLGE